MGIIFLGFALGQILTGITLFVILFILIILGLAELAKAKFSESEVLQNLQEWQSLNELKALIEKNKQGKVISSHRLFDVLKKLECEKKISYKPFPLTREEALKYNQKFMPKYKII